MGCPPRFQRSLFQWFLFTLNIAMYRQPLDRCCCICVCIRVKRTRGEKGECILRRVENPELFLAARLDRTRDI